MAGPIAKAVKSYLGVGDEALGYIEPELDTLLRTQKYHPLYNEHPGLDQSAAHLFSNSTQKFINEMATKPDTNRAVAMVTPEEYFAAFGRPDATNPTVRRSVRRFGFEAKEGNGIEEFVSVNATVGPKGELVVGNVRGSEVMAYMDSIDPKGKVPVLIQTNGFAWDAGGDLPTHLMVGKKTFPMFNMPRYADRLRPQQFADPVEEGVNPAFYKNQSVEPAAVRRRLSALHDPDALAAQETRMSMVHTFLGSTDDSPVSMYEGAAFEIGHVPRVDAARRKVIEGSIATELQAQEGLVKSLDKTPGGLTRLQQLLGDTPYTRSVMGDKGPLKDRPLVLFRTDAKDVVPKSGRSVSPALENPRELGMHAGTSDVASQFSGTAARVADRRGELKQLASTVFGKDYNKGTLKEALVGATRTAQAEWDDALGPGKVRVVGSDGPSARVLRKHLELNLRSLVAEGQSATQFIDKFVGHVRETAGTRTVPFFFGGKKPLFLMDTGGWSPTAVLKQLEGMPAFQRYRDEIDQIKEEIFGIDTDDIAFQGAVRDVQRIIERAGFDHVAYLNRFEKGVDDIPKLSIIAWKPDQIVERFDPRIGGKAARDQYMSTVLGTAAAAIGLDVLEPEQTQTAENP